MKKVTVVGSIAMDFVVKTTEVPNQGETLIGESFTTHFGGKGANQAVAASRLGADVSMIGTVGEDVFGDQVLQNLIANQITVSGVETTTKAATGVAHIIVKDGDNRIIVVPGANNQLSLALLKRQEKELAQSDMVIMQNEIPASIVEWVTGYCFERKIPVILNPAPARSLKAETLAQASYLTPNESEAKILFPDLSLEEALAAYPNKLIVTLGSQGAVFHDGKQLQKVAAFKVNPLDTTGAGDTFNGGLAVALTNGLSLRESITFGNLASSVAVQVNGAQAGIPYLEELKGHENYEETWHIEQ